MEALRYHRHYQLQAHWLAESRASLFRRAAIATREEILDFGCGSGVLTSEAARLSLRPVRGVDRDRAMIDFAGRNYPGLDFECTDENGLLEAGRRFDLVFLSFVLAWQPRPAEFLNKLKRLLRPNGLLLLLAEPDYGGRIDHPPELEELARLFADHIRSGGGDPFIGRKVPGLLAEAGFQAWTGVIAQNPVPPIPDRESWEQEWSFWQELTGLPDDRVRRWRQLDAQALESGRRVMFMPVFCALAQPGPD